MIIVDLSKWNVIHSSDMARLKAKGVRGAMVQLTAGTGYPNHLAENQIKLSKSYFGWCGAYHYYYGNYRAESSELLAYLRKCKISKHAPVAIDIEEPSLAGNQISNVNKFLSILNNHGYDNLFTYSMASWFWTGGKLTPSSKIRSKLWIANYGATSSGVKDTTLFQFTDNFKGEHVDASLTEDGFHEDSNKVKVKNCYHSHGRKFKVTTGVIHGYLDKACKQRCGTNLTKGSTIHARPVKVGSHVYRLESKIGYFSANTRFTKKIK